MQIGTTQWFKSPYPEDALSKLNPLALQQTLEQSTFKFQFTATGAELQKQIDKALDEIESAHKVYQSVISHPEMDRSVIYRLEDRDNSTPDIFDSEISHLQTGLDHALYIDSAFMGPHIARWDTLDPNRKEFHSKKLENQFNNYKILSNEERKNFCEDYLTEIAEDHPNVTKIFGINQTVSQLKATGSIYHPTLGHSLNINTAWMLGNIHSGRSMKICSQITKDTRLRKSEELPILSAFTHEIGIALNVGYQLAWNNGELMLSPPPQLTASQLQSITFEDIKLESAGANDVIRISRWAGIIQKDKSLTTPTSLPDSLAKYLRSENLQNLLKTPEATASESQTIKPEDSLLTTRASQSHSSPIPKDTKDTKDTKDFDIDMFDTTEEKPKNDPNPT